MPRHQLVNAIEGQRNCRICDARNSGFNYGVQSCNSCKMFFRRALDAHSIILCKNNGTCSIPATKCRFCRFHQCIRVGMKFLDDSNPTDVIMQLKLKDSVRKNDFLNSKCATAVSFSDIFTRGSFSFTNKEDSVFDFYDWGVMNHLTCINYETQFSFMKYLSIEDLKQVLKYSHLMYMILVTAMRSYSAGHSNMCHPDNSDIFPSEVQHTLYDKSFIQEIRCYLISRLIELEVTEEEFLLLGAILICNPAVPDLSQSGQILLGTYRSMYASNLRCYCQLQYGGAGCAIRYPEILFLCHVVARTHTKIADFSNLFPIAQPQHVKQNLFTEILAFLIN